MNGLSGHEDTPWLGGYPAGVDWRAPISEEPLTAALDRSIELYESNTCVDFLGRRFSYKEIGDLVARAAKGFQDLGVGKGVQVGLLLPNTPYSIVCYYAVLKAGGTVVNFNPLYVAEEVERQIADSQTRVMVTMDLKLTLPKATQALGRTPLEKVVVCSMAEALPFTKSSLFRLLGRGKRAPMPDDGLHLTFEALTDNDGDYRPAAIDPRRDVAVLQYTGGTTGHPMGAMLTHANIAANTRQVAMWNPDMRPGEERVLGVLPLFHVFAMTVVMNLGVLIGAELILVPRFEIGMVLRTLRRCRPTQFPGVPTLFNALLHHDRVDGDALGSLQFCLSGGAPLPGEVRREFEALTGCRLIEGYGLSETSPVVTCNPLDGEIKDGSVGLPLPGTVVEIRSLDDPGRRLGTGESGEVCVGGPQIMAGYWRQPEATAKALRDGWVHTGDVGYLDEDGYLFLIDRLKDLIIRSGYNIYPRVIEEAIYRHPAVAETTVCVIPDDYHGEVPKAFVRVKDGEALNAKELLAFLADKLSPIEMPQEIEFRDELPKTLVGKLSKKELIAEEKARRSGNGAGTAPPDD
jgi:long-chain acyl-CoA synthetase